MAASFYIIVILAILGPFGIPFALLNRVKSPSRLATIGLTNAITALPMVGMTVWARYFPGPSCLETSPGAPCDGIPASAAWLIFAVLFGALAIWGIIGSSVTTLRISARQKKAFHLDPHLHG